MSTNTYERRIMRDEFDNDIFHLGYRWVDDHKHEHKRLACSVHIDDIEGMFGEESYTLVNELAPGKWEWLP